MVDLEQVLLEQICLNEFFLCCIVVTTMICKFYEMLVVFDFKYMILLYIVTYFSNGPCFLRRL